MHVVDLLTGEEQFFGCFGGEDGGVSVTSGGGELLVGTSWLAVGASGTDRKIHLYDTTGREIVHPANPVAESCAPCELEAHLSVDGSLLAYRLRPDAKWSLELEDLQRIDQLTHEEWWNTTKHIPSHIGVVDLERGEEVFSIAAPAGERLVDFDGRRLVIESCDMVEGEEDIVRTCSSRVVSIESDLPEVVVTGSVRLADEVCCQPPGADVFPPFLRVWSPWDGEVVDSHTYRFEGVADPDATLVAAGRPVIIEPHATWSIELELQPGPNAVAITATDDAGNTTTIMRNVILDAGPTEFDPDSWIGVTFTVDGPEDPHEIKVGGEPTGFFTPWWLAQPCCDDHDLLVVASPNPEEFDSERMAMIWLTTRGDASADNSRTVLLSEGFVVAPGMAFPDSCDDGTPGTTSERLFGITALPPPYVQEPVFAWRVHLEGIEQVDTAGLRCGFITD